MNVRWTISRRSRCKLMIVCFCVQLQFNKLIGNCVSSNSNQELWLGCRFGGGGGGGIAMTETWSEISGAIYSTKKNSHNLHFWFAHLKCVDVWFANVWIKYEHVYWTSRKQRPTEIKLTFYFSIQIGFVTRIDHIEEKNGNGEKKKFK